MFTYVFMYGGFQNWLEKIIMVQLHWIYRGLNNDCIMCYILLFIYLFFSQQWKQDLMVYLGVESGDSHLVHVSNVKLA